MTASSRAWAGLLLASCVFFAGAPAHAQPTAAQKEAARNLMAEGRELREQGNLEAALARFTAADSIMNVPTTAYEMAATQAELGKLVEAGETVRRLLALAHSPGDPAPFNEARVKARALEQRLDGRTPTLRLVISGAATADSPRVTLDGEPLLAASLGLPFRVNPGKHVVVVRAGDHEESREVDAVEGLSAELHFALRPPRAEPPPSAVPADNGPRRRPSAVSRSTPGAPIPALSYVGGGVFVAGMVVGGVTGLAALSHKNSAARSCVNGECPPSTFRDLDSARSFATISTVGFVVGAVGFAVGASALLLREQPRAPVARTVRVVPDVGPRGGSLTIAGRF